MEPSLAVTRHLQRQHPGNSRALCNCIEEQPSRELVLNPYNDRSVASADGSALHLLRALNTFPARESSRDPDAIVRRRTGGSYARACARSLKKSSVYETEGWEVYTMLSRKGGEARVLDTVRSMLGQTHKSFNYWSEDSVNVTPGERMFRVVMVLAERAKRSANSLLCSILRRTGLTAPGLGMVVRLRTGSSKSTTSSYNPRVAQ
jgi:hypothetical protein